MIFLIDKMSYLMVLNVIHDDNYLTYDDIYYHIVCYLKLFIYLFKFNIYKEN
jgi:hypothetical protein